MGFVIGVTCPRAAAEPEHVVAGPGRGGTLGETEVRNEEFEVDLLDPEQAEVVRRGVYMVVCPVCGHAFEVEV